MATYTHKTVSLAAPIAYSLVFHAVVLGSVLTMPLYSGGWGHKGSFAVHLESAPVVSAVKTTPDAGAAKGPVAGRALSREDAQAVRTPKLPKLIKQVQKAPREPQALHKSTNDMAAKPEQEARPEQKEAASGAASVFDEKAAKGEPPPVKPRPEEAAVVVIRGTEERVETPGAARAEATGTTEIKQAPPASVETVEAEVRPDTLSERTGWQEPGVGHPEQNERDAGPEMKEQALSSNEPAAVDRPTIIVTEIESEKPVADMAKEPEARAGEGPAERPGEPIPPAVEPTAGGLIEMASAKAPSLPGEASASAVDMLCVGCLMMARLDGNPAEHIIGDAEGKRLTKEIFLSPLREFCRDCLAPDEETGKAVLWEASEGEPEEAAARAEGAGEALVMEVPRADSDGPVESEKERPGAEARGAPERDRPVAEIFTPEKNPTPTRAEYAAELDETLRRMKEEDAHPERGGRIGLPLPVRKDLEIRVFFEEGLEGLSFRLLRRPHPMDKRREAEADITGELEELVSTGGQGPRAIYSLSRAERGVYVFVVENSGASADVGIRFLLYEGIGQERAKEYPVSSVAPGAPRKIKFLMPEAVFWDDEDYFTGAIEGPDTVTKFSDVTGLVWKEYVGR